MILLTRFNGSTFILNSELIETVAATPDTVITTNQGKVYVVKENVDEVVEKIIKFRGKILFAGRINENNVE